MRGVASRCRAANCIPLAVARGFAACANEGLCRLGQLHCSRKTMIAGNRGISSRRISTFIRSGIPENGTSTVASKSLMVSVQRMKHLPSRFNDGGR